MDPLSICASAIAVLQAVSSLGKTIRKVQSMVMARDEVSALLDEVSDLEVVFQSAKDILETLLSTNTIIDKQKTSLITLLDRAQKTLTQMDHFMKDRLIRKSALKGTLKINHIAWLAAKPRLQRFQADLRHLRYLFVATISSTILYVFCHILRQIERKQQLLSLDRVTLLKILNLVPGRRHPLQVSKLRIFILVWNDFWTVTRNGDRGPKIHSRVLQSRELLPRLCMLSWMRRTLQLSRLQVILYRGHTPNGYVATRSIPSRLHRCSEMYWGLYL